MACLAIKTFTQNLDNDRTDCNKKDSFEYPQVFVICGLICGYTFGFS